MKKFLSLVLALVMAMSLVTVSAGAKDFDDSDKISGVAYEEAVNVMSEMGIIDGYADGNFQPQGTLTRGAAAKIIACMMLGKTTAEALGTQAAPFKDVPVGSTFAGYIAYCSESGIIDGYSDGTFRPGNTLTGFAFLKMLLTALGYDSEIEGYANNANWTVNVAGRAKQIGLVDGNEDFVGTRAATREEACLYAVNALQATLVEYTDKGANITIGDTTISTGASNATYVTSNVYDAATSIDDTIDNTTHDYTVEFAEKYQPKLALRHDTDDFMRPAHTWTWDKKEIGTYVDYDKMVAEYTEGVTGDEVYDLLTATIIKENDLLAYVDGTDIYSEKSADGKISKNDLVRNNKDDLGVTDDGVLTQIFLDTKRGEITIASINTYLAKASSSYSSTSESATLKVYENVTGVTQTVDVDDVPEIADVEKDAFYIVNMTTKHSSTGKLEVVEIAEPEILADSTVTKWSKDDATVVSKLTVDGTEYKANVKAFYDEDTLEDYDKGLLTDMTYNVYLDANGYIIGVDLYEGTLNYVFITGYDRFGSYISVKTADAAAIFTDGSMDEIVVNVADTNDNIVSFCEDPDNAGVAAMFGEWDGDGNELLNRWYTYTVDANGRYTLKPVARQIVTDITAAHDEKNPEIIDCSNVYLDGNRVNTQRVYGNDNSVYITAETGAVDLGDEYAITDTTGTYTGVQDVEIEVINDAKLTEGEIYTIYDKDLYVIASVVVGEARGNVTNYAYILSEEKSEEKIDDTYYWEFEAVLNGEKVTLTAQSKYSNTIDVLRKNTIQELRFTGDYVTKIVPKTVDLDDPINNKIVAGTDEIYHVTGISEGTLYLEGRTLHLDDIKMVDPDNALLTITGDSYGLTFVKDAKAVVIQPVNTKSTTTAYSSVDEAVAALGDADINDPGKQYEGSIAAVLNSQGVAEWIVFNSKTDAGSGVGPGYDPDTTNVIKTSRTDSSATLTEYAVASNGRLSMSGVYNAPAFVADGTVDLDVDVFSDGVYYDTFKVTANVRDGKANFSYRSASGIYETDEVLKFEITNEDFSTVKVLYVDANNNDITGKLVAGYTKSLAVGTYTTDATNDIVFTYKTTSTANSLSWGAKQDTNVLRASAGFGTNDSTQQTLDLNTTITDDAAVVVTITGTPVEVYTFGKSASFDTDHTDIAKAVKQTGAVAVAMDKFGLTAATHDTLKVEWDKAAGLHTNDQVKLTATVTGKNDALSYDVTVVTNVGSFTLTGVKDGTAVDKYVTVGTENVEITNVTVAVNTVALADVAKEDVTVNMDNLHQMVIQFNTAVTLADGKPLDTSCFTGGSMTVTAVSMSSDNKTATLTFSTALTDSATVKIVASKIANAAAVSDTAAAKTITVTGISTSTPTISVT